MTNPSAAPFIDERADYGTEGKDELAKFTSNQIMGSIATGGFYMIIPRNGPYEFVLKPGTIRYMTMIYNFPQNTK